ncbi:MAG: ATP-binding protein, partial [Methanomicrobiales archaeon]|nr:ATP-binding protein [Methanomicrobiales archaeon]
STIVALLAQQYAQKGKRVLVVDTDESNAGLHRLLGTDAPQDLMDYFGGKKTMMQAFREARENESTSPVESAKTIESIPGIYKTQKDNIHLVAIGKIHQPGEGCACPMGVLAKQFLTGLELSENDIAIIDTEAGIEHFGRGIDKVCDAILMVIDPSYESLNLATMVSEMAEKIGVPLYYVLNKTDERTAPALRNAIHDKSRVIGEFPQDADILAAGLEGRKLPADYPVVSGIITAIGLKRAFS